MRGADVRIRTGDLLITSELLYQLSYVGPGRPPMGHRRMRGRRVPAPPGAAIGARLRRLLRLAGAARAGPRFRQPTLALTSAKRCE
jgi:hypothetical protein